MNSIPKVLAAAIATVALCAQAQDDDFGDVLDLDAGDSPAEEVSASGEDAETADESSVQEPGGEENAGGDEGEEASSAEKTLAAPKKAVFHLLPVCKRIDGAAEVLSPGAEGWVSLEEERYYPLGSVFRTIGLSSRAKIMLGPDCELVLGGNSTVGTRAQKVGDKDRALNLIYGTARIKVPAGMPEGLLSISTPAFTVKDLKGESRYRYVNIDDGTEAVVRCVTQTLKIEGSHFTVPMMRAANEMGIVTSIDMLFTALYGRRGDIPVTLDQGRVLVKDYSTGENKEEDKSLEWKLSPKTAVRIHRAKPALGERLAVTTMTFDANGRLQNRCVFVEKEPLVNSGELGPVVKLSKEELAKDAGGLVDLSAKAEDTVTEEAGESESEQTESPDGDGETAGDSVDDDLDL